MSVSGGGMLSGGCCVVGCRKEGRVRCVSGGMSMKRGSRHLALTVTLETISNVSDHCE